jgi:hypothetical protein
MSLADKFSLIQKNLSAKIFELSESTRPWQPVEDRNFFIEVAKYGKDICELALGDLGVRLYEMSDILDLNHPEIKSGSFMTSIEGEDIFEKLKQFLCLCKLAKEHQLDAITSSFSKCMTKTIFSDAKLSLQKIQNQQQYVRLLRDDSKREQIRSIKQIRTIDLSLPIKKFSGMWDSLSSLEVHGRFGNYHQEQLQKITQRAEVYKQLRLESMYSEIQGYIKEFGDAFEEGYYGFQRISIALAAVILAKMHNCTLDENKFPPAIYMPAGNFDFDFMEGQSICFTSTGTAVQKSMPDFTYSPMTYPIGKLEVPEALGKIVAHLEAFPEADGKPIFDQFVVVVPGVNPHWGYPACYFFDKSGKKRQFADGMDLKIALDTMLIKEKYIIPAVLGEKDGKCYFIGFWE